MVIHFQLLRVTRPSGEHISLWSSAFPLAVLCDTHGDGIVHCFAANQICLCAIWSGLQSHAAECSKRVIEPK